MLTFEAAVQEMLENNFDIQIADNSKAIAHQLNNIGTAGFLPSLSGRAGYEQAYRNTEQVFFDGRQQGANNARSSTLTASVLLNWTLFDGMRMFATKSILEANEALSDYYLRAAVEEGVVLLGSLYFQIAQRSKLLELYRNTLLVSRERYQLALKRQQIGSGSRQDVLQALIDLHADSIQLMRTATDIADLKTELNLLLARDVTVPVETDLRIPIDTSLTLTVLLEAASKENTDLLVARENIRIAQHELRVARSYFYPEAGIYAGFDFAKSTSQVGVLQSNRSYGPGVGIFITYNLFNGLRDYKNLKVSKIRQENSLIAAAKASASVHAQILQHYQNYELAKKTLLLEQESEEKANENLQIALKKFELGNITSVEFRSIQLQALEAATRRINALYAIKMHELELSKLAGIMGL
ncbi:MAG: membrane protein [Chitinophagales bacterium]|nr:MAG: membrane protein [Chitinophagales bacterium]